MIGLQADGGTGSLATRITATELARSLSKVLDRARYRGEAFVVQRNGQDVVRIEPSQPPLAITPRQLAERLGQMPMPGNGFAEDLEAIQALQGDAEVREWDS
jgi:antitoxin (DNA-binding transcriptional repressor) of toxin-antitoxin stability system